MTNDELRKALTVERMMCVQLEKRLLLMDHCFSEALEHERELVALYNSKAIEYWRIALRCRKKVAELTGEIEKAL